MHGDDRAQGAVSGWRSAERGQATHAFHGNGPRVAKNTHCQHPPLPNPAFKHTKHARTHKTMHMRPIRSLLGFGRGGEGALVEWERRGSNPTLPPFLPPQHRHPGLLPNSTLARHTNVHADNDASQGSHLCHALEGSGVTWVDR
jgi:hypothetical protein